MSIVFAKPDASVVVRGTEAEVVGSPKAAVKLLVDSSSAGGALSTVQVSLDVGADGAKPHRHEQSAEMFYVLEGAVRVLSGDQILHAERGDVIVVPPGLAHAFAAEQGSKAELLIVIAPG